MKKRNLLIEQIDAEELVNKIKEIIVDTIKKEHPPPARDRSRLMSLSETAEYVSYTQLTLPTIHMVEKLLATCPV